MSAHPDVERLLTRARSHVAAPELLVARAPGRLDVLGGIADYSGATVLEMPLDRAVVAAAGLRGDRCVRVESLGASGGARVVELELDELGAALRDPAAARERFAADPERAWAAYVLGAFPIWARAAGFAPERGVDLLLESTVPEGAGVSSSAALEVAALAALAAAYGLERTPAELAFDAQAVENRVVGAPCGIMDQMTAVFGEQDRLLRLRCQPATVEGQVPVPPGVRFLGVDSGVRHAVSGADYASVRVAAFMGLRMVSERLGEDTTGGWLANLDPDHFEAELAPALPEALGGAEFLARYGGTADPVTTVDPERTYAVRCCAAHPVHEQARVLRFAELLPRAADPAVAEELGALMLASHASYSACGLGSEATDRLVGLVREVGPAGGLFGAKITGGGSGGTVAILARDDAVGTVLDVARRFGREVGREPAVFRASSPGMAALGVHSAR